MFRLTIVGGASVGSLEVDHPAIPRRGEHIRVSGVLFAVTSVEWDVGDPILCDTPTITVRVDNYSSQ